MVCGGNSVGDLVKAVAQWEFTNRPVIYYAYQTKPNGVAGAIKEAKSWVNKEPVAVILGDNLFDPTMCDLRGSITEAVRLYEKKESRGAHLFLVDHKTPEHFGVVEWEVNEANSRPRINAIIEKPRGGIPSSTVVTGLYLYDETVWERIDRLVQSERKEFEVTDLNNAYLLSDQVDYTLLEGWWCDAGESVYSYQKVNQFVTNLYGG